MHHPAFINDPLRDEVFNYAHWGLAWTTQCTYSSSEKSFITFCLMNQLVSDMGDILPACEGTLIYFASHLARTANLATQCTYSSSEKSFITFCLMNRLVSDTGDILPACEGTLIYFASHLARTVRHSTIKLYLVAVRNLHISCGHGDPLMGKLLLKKVLRGILRFQGQHRILCRPVTPRILLASNLGNLVRTEGFPRDLGHLYFSLLWISAL